MPNIPGDIEKVLQNVSSREGLRVSKNVNRKLQKLKEQIRLEKEEKKRKRKAVDEPPETKSKTVDDTGDDDGLLVVKARHEPVDKREGEEDVPLSFAKPRKPKKIRIDGGNSNLSKHTIFEDDGTEQPTIFSSKTTCDDSEDSSGDDEEIEKALRGANDGYLEQVRQRLEKTKELDKQEERERIRAKHKKKRMKGKPDLADGDDDGNVQVATLVTTLGNDDCSSDSESSSDDDNSNGSDDDDARVDRMNVSQQEELALSLIRGIS